MGQVGLSLLPPSLPLDNQMPHRASLLEGNRVLLSRGSCRGASEGAGARDTSEASGRREAVRIPLAANSRSAGLRGRGGGAAQGKG